MHKHLAIANFYFDYLEAAIDQKFGNFSTVKAPIKNRLSPVGERSAMLYSPGSASGEIAASKPKVLMSFE